MLCLPLFSDAWLGRLKLSAAEAEEVIYKQTNKQTNKQSVIQTKSLQQVCFKTLLGP
jgi:hypothetical protein